MGHAFPGKSQSKLMTMQVKYYREGREEIKELLI